MPQPPNILLIHTHDTGRYLGCYGEDVATPNIDALASQSTQFDNYFATAPQCSPSRASVLTGLYPHRCGMLGLAHLGWRLSENVPTLPRILAEAAGYDTVLFGVQHEAGDGRELGYQETQRTEMPQRAQVVAPAFAEYLTEREDLANCRPFFASVGFWETHRPFDEAIYGPDPAPRVPPYLPDTPGSRTELAQFRGLLQAVDDGVGTILAALDRTQFARDTLVIFTSDHGMAFPRAKGTLYDAGLGIPLLIRWPDRVPAGARSEELTSNVDLLPTILELAGSETGGDFDGRSFAGRLLGNDGKPEREEIFAELTWHDRYSPVRAVRTRRWKYIRHFEDGPQVYLPVDVHRGLAGQDVRESYYASQHPPEELYDLDSDPLETENLAARKEHAAVFAQLRSRLENSMERTGDPLLRGPVPGEEAPGWAQERAKEKFPF
jgi:N-sulfoglucosamine sulfohydrolase